MNNELLCIQPYPVECRRLKHYDKLHPKEEVWSVGCDTLWGGGVRGREGDTLTIECPEEAP